MSTLSVAELESTTVELLPARETLAWINVNVANVTAINLALAFNAGAFGSATAIANQLVVVEQYN